MLRIGASVLVAEREGGRRRPREWKVDRLIEAGPLADGLAWAPSQP